MSWGDDWRQNDYGRVVAERDWFESQCGDLSDELQEAQLWAEWFAAERDWIANGS